MRSTVIDDYIASCPKDRQDKLKQMRKIIKETLPEASECLKYGMPTFYQGQNLVHFANAKNHIGFYPTPEPIVHFKEELSGYKTSKGAIQFKVTEELPEELIKRICLWRLNQVKQ